MIQVSQMLVADPAMTAAEIRHQRLEHPDRPNIGKAYVNVNLSSRIGGFAAYKSKTNAQIEAAYRFKCIHDDMQIGGARAIDLENPIVDTSFKPSSINMDYGQDAQKNYTKICRDLGMQTVSLIEQVVIYDTSQRSLANKIDKPERTARRIVQKNVYEAMDKLAGHFNL